ncbi:MAG TPA: hypothetical protein VJT85_01220 [Gemmatimonadaceae bacterium]|nr:hypothetical protein [Gemmatimonadaceae bacterium]
MARRPLARRLITLRFACGLVALLNTTGCMSWRAVPARDAQIPGDASYRRARVVLRDGTTLSLNDVTVRPDSLIGFAGDERTRVAVAQPQVERIETRGVSAGRTIGLVGGVLAVIALAVLVAIAQALSDFEAAPSPIPSVP